MAHVRARWRDFCAFAVVIIIYGSYIVQQRANNTIVFTAVQRLLHISRQAFNFIMTFVYRGNLNVPSRISSASRMFSSNVFLRLYLNRNRDPSFFIVFDLLIFRDSLFYTFSSSLPLSFSFNFPNSRSYEKERSYKYQCIGLYTHVHTPGNGRREK